MLRTSSLQNTIEKKSMNNKHLIETSHSPGTQERFATQYVMTMVRPRDACSNVITFYDSK